MNLLRVHRLINDAIRTFSLDLNGLRILTEAATGYYALTPLIAALAGAERVYALTRDSCYGPATKVRDDTMELAHCWGVTDRIEVFCSRDDPRIKDADIVTNLGFVRPLDANFLRRLKPTSVISMMWEAWEYRPEDLDLGECRRLGIPVLGTNEHYPDLQTFGYIGLLALKLLFALDIEVYRCNIVILGSGEFCRITAATLQSEGARVIVADPGLEGVLKTERIQEALQIADAIVIVEHRNRKMFIGPRGDISAEELHAVNPALAVAHICGGVDRYSLGAVGLRCYPDRFAAPGYMSLATDYLGPKPLVDLHAAGLKVGELMWHKKQVLNDAKQIEQILAEEHSLCQCLTQEG